MGAMPEASTSSTSPASTMFRSKLAGFNLVSGTTQSTGTKLSLTIDSALNATAYKALAGRSGAVLVCNYKTGEILCMINYFIREAFAVTYLWAFG